MGNIVGIPEPGWTPIIVALLYLELGGCEAGTVYPPGARVTAGKTLEYRLGPVEVVAFMGLRLGGAAAYDCQTDGCIGIFPYGCPRLDGAVANVCQVDVGALVAYVLTGGKWVCAAAEIGAQVEYTRLLGFRLTDTMGGRGVLSAAVIDAQVEYTKLL